MASQKAHHVTGIAAGVMAAAVVEHVKAGGTYHLFTVLTLLAATAGGTGPDWLEINPLSFRRKLWVTHRTITHSGLLWIASLVYSYQSLGKMWWAPILFGFSCGSLMHLLTDWPNPLGVPWIFTRHSLNLWNSGRCDLILIVLAWGSAFLLIDYLFCDMVHIWWAVHHLQKLLMHRQKFY